MQQGSAKTLQFTYVVSPQMSDKIECNGAAQLWYRATILKEGGAIMLSIQIAPYQVPATQSPHSCNLTEVLITKDQVTRNGGR